MRACTPVSSGTAVNAMVSTISTIQQRDIYGAFEEDTSANDSCYKKVPSLIQDTRGVLNPCQNRKNYLSLETTQKMVQRLLVEKKMPKEALAEALRITVNDLEQLVFKRKKASMVLIPKLNLSLIKLYCSTKFNQQPLKKPRLRKRQRAVVMICQKV